MKKINFILAFLVGVATSISSSAHNFEGWETTNPRVVNQASGSITLGWTDAGESACKYEVLKNGVPYQRTTNLVWADGQYSQGDVYTVRVVKCQDAEHFSANGLAVGGQTVQSACLADITGQASAYPGVVGFGTESTAGRGGETYIVTNLNDSGPGSLRDAVEGGSEATPRLVLFNVAGRINQTSNYEPRGRLTILGESAPGQGIEIYRSSFNSGTNFFRFDNVDHVSVSHMSFIGNPLYDPLSWENSNFHTFVYNTVVGGVDESFQTWQDTTNVTWAYNLISEPLDDGTFRYKGPLFDASSGDQFNLTYAYNVGTDGINRWPLSNGVTLLDIYGNIAYNVGNGMIDIRSQDGKPVRANVVNNIRIAGANTPSNPAAGDIRFREEDGPISAYVSGNVSPVGAVRIDEDTPTPIAEISTPRMTLRDAVDLEAYLAPIVGHSLPARGVSDQRRVDEMVNRTGEWLDATDQVARPTVLSNPAMDSTQADYIPAAWKSDCSVSGDANESIMSNGYSAAENWVFLGMPQNGQ